MIFSDINEAYFDYYYVVDYAIDYSQKDKMLGSMTLEEWYEFKENPVTRRSLQQASITLVPYTSQDYWIETLEYEEKRILKK
jgi:hypothetical protein